MNKPQAIFLCDSTRYIGDVYGEERISVIRELTDLRPGVFTSETLGKADVSKVELIFSSWGMPALSEEQLDKMPALKAVFYAAGATDGFCRPLMKRGIHVVSAWKANAIPVAEFTVAQISLGLKNYFQMARALHNREAWVKNSGPGAYGKTVALLGAGMISTHVQKLLKNYDLNVIVVPSRKERRTLSLEEAFTRSQVVSNHFPDRDDNAGVLYGELFASMPQNGVFINTGRGRQIREDEMCDVLEKRPDLTVLLDVTYPEPPQEDSRLYRLPNVFLSPHIAGSLNDEFRRMADYVIEDCKRFLAGEELLYEVSEDMLLTSR